MRGTSSSNSSGRKAKPSASSSRASNPNSGSSAASGESSVKRVWSVGEPVLVKTKLSSSGGGTSYSVSGDARQPSVRRGKVQRLRSSGAIDIYYDNGEIEERVGKDRIEVDQQLKGSSVKKAQPSAASATRGTTSFQSKGTPKSSSSSSRLTPTAKTSAKPTRAMLEQQQQQTSSIRPTASSRPFNLPTSAQDYDVDQRQRPVPSSSSYTQQQQQQPRIQTSASGAGIARKGRNDEDEHVILFSPVVAAVPDTVAAGAPRRAKTADANSSNADRMTHNSQSASALGRSTTKSATPLRKQSTGRYSDMGEALAENQKQVTDILDTICDSSEDATAVKNSLSQLLRVIRSAPQVTAECLHQQQGELLLLRTIQSHTSHAVLLCYGCVLMRKLSHLSIESTELFVRHGIVDILVEALDRFPEDAILQASACGCLAVLAQSSNTSKNLMLQSSDASEQNVVQLVLSSLAVHSEYSNLTRQVQIYACEVLIELSDYGGSSTSAAIVGHITGRANLATMELLVSLLRQSVVRDDKKVTCVFCALLLWLVLSLTALFRSRC
ncbi:hypothetical protein Gpo141_00010084 [Globisporangium polare]